VRDGRTRCGAIRQQGAVEAVPRHTEIPDTLARNIYRSLSVPEIGKPGPLSDPALQTRAKGRSLLSAKSLGVEKAAMREIKESDWKILRQLHSQALERFCKQILLEIERINCDSAKTFHRKYLDIYGVLQRRDKEIAQTFNGLRR
jgi:hypothetical protein